MVKNKKHQKINSQSYLTVDLIGIFVYKGQISLLLETLVYI